MVSDKYLQLAFLSETQSELKCARRMGYAFSRDRAMPFSHVWYRVNKQEVPFNVVWLSVAVALVMALTVRARPALISEELQVVAVHLQHAIS